MSAFERVSSKDVMPASVAFFAGAAALGLRKARAERYKATHDMLTGLLNAQGFARQLKKMKDPVAVLYADATNLKAVNDRISHTRGDDAIRGTADIITGIIRKEDIAARMGGDEFLVVLNSQGRDQLRHQPAKIAEAVRSRAIEGMHNFLGHNLDLVEVGFDVAVGTAIWEPGMTIADLEQTAEQDMYRVKQEQHELRGQYRQAQ